MPLYSYKCPECERENTFRLPFDHENPLCNKNHDREIEMKRNYRKEGGSVHFKGDGFYVTDSDEANNPASD